MKIIPTYQCEICKKVYREKKDAVNCERRKPGRQIAKVGDIVIARAGFGWYDGDRRWVSNPNVRIQNRSGGCPRGHINCFSDCCTYSFYYVVTAIEIDTEHNWVYHLYTGAMKSSYQSGYTKVGTHYTPVKVESPPRFVVEDSKKYIGRKSESLL